MDDAEDGMTVTYLQDTAQQAGLEASIFPIDEIGWDGQSFVGPDDQPLGAVFKLYPWEWMVREEFGQHSRKRTRCGSSRRGRCCFRTRAFCRFCGSCTRGIRTCWRRASTVRA